jgi:hypothetical protein
MYMQYCKDLYKRVYNTLHTATTTTNTSTPAPLEVLEGLLGESSLLLHCLDPAHPHFHSHSNSIKAVVRYPTGYVLALLHSEVCYANFNK